MDRVEAVTTIVRNDRVLDGHGTGNVYAYLGVAIDCAVVDVQASSRFIVDGSQAVISSDGAIRAYHGFIVVDAAPDGMASEVAHWGVDRICIDRAVADHQRTFVRNTTTVGAAV